MKPMFLSRAAAAPVCSQPSVRQGSAHASFSSNGICFDPNRLAFELDRLAAENRITVLFHTLCTGVLTDENDRICAAIIENKNGRSAVKAYFFIDATGDGNLAKHLKPPSYRNDYIQPPTPCAFSARRMNQRSGIGAKKRDFLDMQKRREGRDLPSCRLFVR